VWIADFLPNDLASPIGAMIEQASTAAQPPKTYLFDAESVSASHAFTSFSEHFHAVIRRPRGKYPNGHIPHLPCRSSPLWCCKRLQDFHIGNAFGTPAMLEI
jgi:hypothetical protein